MTRTVLAVAFAMAHATLLAQTPDPQPAQPAPRPAAPATPQAPPPPATPQSPPPAPKPFPEGARVAYVVLQRIADESAEGKTASTRIQGLQQKRATELQEKNKTLQGLQQKLEKEGGVMSAQAQGDLQKQLERQQVDLQRSQQDAEKELQELQAQLRQEFTRRIEPILAQVGQEKGLHLIFNGPDSGLVWGDPGIDITADVIKRLDATPTQKPGPTAPPAAPGAPPKPPPGR